MEQRLRLVQGGQQPRGEKRMSERRPLEVPGQIVWKDARGTTKLASVVTRDISDHGVAVQCLNGAAIPLYRLVYFQIDRDARNRPDLPAALRKPNVLSAIFRVGPCSEQTGSPSAYALRLLVEPARPAAALHRQREWVAPRRQMPAPPQRPGPPPNRRERPDGAPRGRPSVCRTAAVATHSRCRCKAADANRALGSAA